MPVFPGCTDINYADLKQCADLKMLDFIYSNRVYPNEAYDNGTQGMAVVSFVVEADGCFSNMKVVRPVGDGIGEEAARIVKLMRAEGWNFEPGYDFEGTTRVQFNLPIKFRIDEGMLVRGDSILDMNPGCALPSDVYEDYSKLAIDARMNTNTGDKALFQLQVETLASFEGRIEIFSATGAVEYFSERRFDGIFSLVDISASRFSKGDKYLVLSSKGGRFELFDLEFKVD